MAKRKIAEAAPIFIKFLGTAGARFVMIKQLRASGGLWVSINGTNVLIDPGPGCIVRCAKSLPKLDPGKLDAIILTHRHLDHCGDANVMIEAMTEGGFKKKGTIFCPADCINGEDNVILKYALALPEKIEIIKAKGSYKVGNFSFEVRGPHIHPAETFGLRFRIKDTNVSLITDTKYFAGLSDLYSETDVLIISVVFFEPRPGVDHLCLDDVKTLAKKIAPKKVIMTHFGMTMLKAKPSIQAQLLTEELGIDVIAAYDGMKVEF